MNLAQSILATAICATLLIGIGVYFTNKSRSANQQFLVLSATICSWLLSLFLVFRCRDAKTAAFFIRLCGITGGFIPVAFTLLRLSIVNPTGGFLDLLRRSIAWLMAYSAIAILCSTRLYLLSAQMPTSGVPDAVYGPFVSVFSVYFNGGLLVVMWNLFKDIRRIQGLRRSELQFLFLGLLNFIGVGLFCAVVPLFTHNSQIVSLAPLWVLLMNVLIAYGIATRRILDVGGIVRYCASYGLLLGYLSTVYTLTWWGADAALRVFSVSQSFLPHLMGTLVVILTMSRVKSIFQVFVSRLFITLHDIDPRDALKRADAILTTVTTTDDLLERFIGVLTNATGTDRVLIDLFQSTNRGNERSIESAGDSARLSPDDLLPRLLLKTRAPFLGSIVSRFEATDLQRGAAKELAERSCALAIGIHGQNSLDGVVLLGERLSGRTYDDEEQEVLQILVNRFASALENATLYTEINRGRVYLDSLLDQLVSGVIAADQEGRITVCNREARRILHAENAAVIGNSIEDLPGPLRDALRQPLFDGRPSNGQAAIAGSLTAPAIPVGFGSRLFSKDAENLWGALVVFEDLTQVKALEEQLRRADRLSSLGALAASLAHEIKNPLVPIRTFVQLIPERHHDPAFLLRFAQIVGDEVKRIDVIVNQLLSFSRARESRFSSVRLHETLDNTISLLLHDLTKRNIRLSKMYEAQSDSVWADNQKLGQVFLNVMLNAYEAMPSGGELSIHTSILPEDGTSGLNGNGGERHGDLLQISLRDTGPGISPEHLDRLFDPFFSTKEAGTGLGLSIVYGIVMEHQGLIDVVSKPNQGASVNIRLPLFKEEKAFV